MAINRIKPGYLSNATVDGGTAADDAFVGYSLANQRTEFITASADTTDLDTISSNVDLRAAQIDANVNTISANADTLVASIDTAEASIDTVSGNVDSFATYANSTFVSSSTESNTFITVELQNDADTSEAKYGNVTANVSADVLTLTAGNGMSFTANGDGQSITLAAKLNAILNDRYTADGTANTFTLSRAVTNADEIIVAVDGVIQVPSNNYSVSSTTLTLSNSLPILNGTLVDVRHLPVTGSEGDVRVVPPFVFQGETAGYIMSGSNQPGSSPSPTDIIEKILYTSDTNSTDLTEGSGGAGAVGDNDQAFQVIASFPEQLSLKRFPFATETLSSTLATTGPSNSPAKGQTASSSSGTHGYATENGGNISKFPFASVTPISTVGSLASGIAYGASHHTSPSAGYTAGGIAPNFNNTVALLQKYPHASDTNASDVGELYDETRTKSRAGASSTTHGYSMGGATTADSTTQNVEKFPFSSDTSTTLNLALGAASFQGGGGSSTTHGYYVGGAPNNNFGYNHILKFPFASDVNASSVGTLQTYRRNARQLAND